jgi:hypothetical protein
MTKKSGSRVLGAMTREEWGGMVVGGTAGDVKKKKRRQREG